MPEGRRIPINKIMLLTKKVSGLNQVSQFFIISALTQVPTTEPFFDTFFSFKV